MVILVPWLGAAGCRAAEPFEPGASSLGFGGGGVDAGSGDEPSLTSNGTGGSAAGSGGQGESIGPGGSGGTIGQGGSVGQGGSLGQGGGAGGNSGPDGGFMIESLMDALADQNAAESSASADGRGSDARDAADSSDTIAEHCPPATWTATASRSASGRPPRNAFDGARNTFWSSGRNQDGTDWFRINFGGVFKLSRVKLDNAAGFPRDYPGGYAVYSSLDGTTFKGPLTTGTGMEGLTDIQFPQASLRYLEIRQTGTTHPGFWWQIGEISVDCAP